MITEEQVVALIAAANPVPNPDLLDPVESLDRLDRASAGGRVVAGVVLDRVSGPRGRSRVRLVAGGLIAAGLVAVLALGGTNSRDGQRAVAPPAGNGLIAVVGESGDNPSRSDIYVVVPDGTGLRALTATAELVEYAPAWSPDGSRLAFVRTADDAFSLASPPCATGCQLVVVDPSTGVETFSADIPDRAGETWVPQSLTWSPDGRAIAISLVPCFVGGCGPGASVIADLETGTFTTFTRGYEAAWSPDGEWLAMVKNGNELDPSLLLVPADRITAGDVVDIADLDGVRPLPERPGEGFGGVEWMPDGSALLVSNLDPDADLIAHEDEAEGWIDVVTVSDGTRRLLIEDGFDPVVSPDGSQIAYSHERAPAGVKQIWVAAADGSDPRPVIDSFTTPAWSPDGSLLFASDGEGWFTVRADGTDRTALGIRDHAPAFPSVDNDWGIISGRVDWQPLPAGTSVPTLPSAEEVARGFVEAWGAFDADRVITNLADDADITGLIDWFTTEEVQGTRDELRLLLSLLEAQSYQQMLDSCDQLSSSATETTVRCTFEFHALRSDELGLGPFSGSYFDLTVADGEIVRASTNSNSEQFSNQVWSPFADWMEANHPDDAAVMYSSPAANGARLTEEAIPLWEQHTTEYVDSQAEEVARGFVEAWGAFDADGLIIHLANDADITGLVDWFTTEEVQGTLDELRLLLSLLEAQSYQQMLDSCDQLSSSATETTVRCTFEFHALRSDELGLGPFSGSYFDLTVADGEIVRASTNSNSEQFSNQVWSPFADWMEANHPDDAAVMYSSPAGGARLTEEAIPLWEQHTTEYVDSQAAAQAD